MRVAIIINPISGTGGRPAVARQRAELAAALVSARGVDAEIFVTERPGHAGDLTRAALARGTMTVAAWGGDGTINEIASVLAFTGATLAVIPSGSGNGLARELQIPLAPADAFRVALDPAAACTRLIDAGDVDGRLFFNIAGIGLDARVAHQFAVGGLVRRGFARYLEIALREILTHAPDDLTIVVDGVAERHRALLVAIANGRQYGNGALIAPGASMDDGRLDVVVVAHRPALLAMLQVPWVFAGRVNTLPGVTRRRGTSIEVRSARPVMYHLDGEPLVGETTIAVRVRPGALRIRAPKR